MSRTPRRFSLFVALAALGACALPPRPAPIVPPPLALHGLPATAIDVEHYAIELVLDPPARSIDAVTRDL